MADAVSGHMPGPSSATGPGLSSAQAAMFLAGLSLTPTPVPVLPHSSAVRTRPGPTQSTARAQCIAGANGLGAGLSFTNTGVQNVPSAYIPLGLTCFVAEPSLPISRTFHPSHIGVEGLGDLPPGLCRGPTVWALPSPPGHSDASSSSASLRVTGTRQEVYWTVMLWHMEGVPRPHWGRGRYWGL